MSAFLSPFYGYCYREKKITKPVAHYIIRESLKLSNAMSEKCNNLIKSAYMFRKAAVHLEKGEKTEAQLQAGLSLLIIKTLYSWGLDLARILCNCPQPCTQKTCTFQPILDRFTKWLEDESILIERVKEKKCKSKRI